MENYYKRTEQLKSENEHFKTQLTLPTLNVHHVGRMTDKCNKICSARPRNIKVWLLYNKMAVAHKSKKIKMLSICCDLHDR